MDLKLVKLVLIVVKLVVILKWWQKPCQPVVPGRVLQYFSNYTSQPWSYEFCAIKNLQGTAYAMEFQLRRWKNVQRWTVVMFVQKINVYSKMVEIINFMLCLVYLNKHINYEKESQQWMVPCYLKNIQIPYPIINVLLKSKPYSAFLPHVLSVLSSLWYLCMA